MPLPPRGACRRRRGRRKRSDRRSSCRAAAVSTRPRPKGRAACGLEQKNTRRLATCLVTSACSLIRTHAAVSCHVSSCLQPDAVPALLIYCANTCPCLYVPALPCSVSLSCLLPMPCPAILPTPSPPRAGALPLRAHMHMHTRSSTHIQWARAHVSVGRLHPQPHLAVGETVILLILPLHPC